MDTKSKYKIAYADDAVINHLMMEAIAPSYAVELVYCAVNGFDLIEYLAENGDALPGACILDLHMPRLNGIETTKILRERFPSVRIFGLTSSSDENERLHMLEVGAEEIFSKEDMSALLELLSLDKEKA